MLKVVIMGLGVAGANAAQAIAARRPDAQVDVYGAEPHVYYMRPKLPAFLAGEVEERDLYLHTPAWYEQQRIAAHTSTRVEAIEPAAHRVVLEGGARVAYDRLLIAAGARPFMPPIQGADLPGVFNLWTIEDAQRIRSFAQGRKRAVVVGGGLLGLEAARALHALGLEVTVLENGPHLMPRQLDAQGAAVFQEQIEALGIGVHNNATCERIEGAGRPEAAVLKGGERLSADLVLVAAGARSNTQVAQAAGLATNRGIVVDAHLQTSAPGIYAAGDVAEFAGTVYGIIPAALEQAQAAAANLAEIEPREYRGTVRSNTLKIVGLDLTSVGEFAPAGEGYVELRRSGPKGQYMKLTLKDGRLQGAILLGRKALVAEVSQAVQRRLDVGAHGDALLRDDFDWKAALAAAGSS